MKKTIATLVATLFMSASAFSASMTYNIPDEKVAEYISYFVRLHPNTETEVDPSWVDLGDGEEAPMVAKYNDAQWFKEKIKQMMIRDINRGKQLIARDAIDKTPIAEDVDAE